MQAKTMHLSLAFILLLASSIALALGAPHPQSPKSTEKPTGCQQSVTWFHKFFVVSAKDETEFNFAVRTLYTVYYPNALDKALRLEGFQTRVLTTYEACGWQKARSVHSKSSTLFGAHRGDVYWKYRDLHWVNSKSTKEAAHWNTTSPDHIPPHKGAVPKKKTLDMIARVLKANEPAADVYLLSTIGLSYLSAFLGMLVLLQLLARYLSQRAKETKVDDTEGIELATIKVNSLDKPSPASASTDTLATSRRLDESARSSNASRQSTPLPQYSPDGTLRDDRTESAREQNANGHSTPPPGYSPESAFRSIRSGNAVSRLKEAYGVNVNRVGSI